MSPAPAGRDSQDSVIAQLRARLAVVEASCDVMKTIPGTEPGARAGATAASAVAPTAAKRSAANIVLQQGENKRFVDLVQTKDVPREVGEKQ